jgi:hypothetical protein
MQREGRLMTWLYSLNTALLATHEIDSAFWHEWELFHIPGGIQVFLALNLLLLLIVLYGFDRVARLAPGMKIFSYLLAGAGIFAFAIHTIFIATGHPEFRTPVSLGVLVATLLVSIGQIVVTARNGSSSSTFSARS